MNNEHEYEKALIFKDRKTKVHVIKINGFFYNGIILEVGNSFFIIKDRKDGKEWFILFSELKKPLEQYQEVEV